MTNIHIINPHTLTLITTYRCTASCPNCCFNCSPSPVNKKTMTIQEIKSYIALVKKTFPSIKVVVFTGGECTLLNDDLYEGISFAKKLGLSTRIVTNGHWCDNEK